MKNSKLLAKSITLGLILAMPYSVVSADDIVQESYSVGSNSTVTGMGSITISGYSFIAGKLGDCNNKQFGAENFTTGNLGLEPNGVIYVGKLVTTSESVNSAISGKIYANNIEFNNAKVSFNNSAEIIAENSLTITTSETITNNSNIVANTITMNNYLINRGSITANKKLTTNNFTIDNRGNISGSSIEVGDGSFLNQNVVDITGILDAGQITNNNTGNMTIGTINSTGNVVNSGTIQGANGITNVNIIVSDESGEIINRGEININGKIQTENGRIYNTDNLTAGTIVTNGQVRNDANGKISITDTINANSLYNSGSVSGNELITPGGVTNGGFSAGSYTDAFLKFNSIETRDIINTGEIVAQTIENKLNIANMGK